VKGPTIGRWARYTEDMETVVLVLLAVVVTLVAIDALARLDERARNRRHTEQPEGRDDDPITTQKIVVDLSKRG
jgi:hypothetical protein